MALIKCTECGREVSDKAVSCPGCGAPIAQVPVPREAAPSAVSYTISSDMFSGTMPLMVKLAMRAVQEIGWKLDNVNENLGLVTFQTSISWGSWSGVACSLSIEECGPNQFRVTGSGKQNLSGLQLVAINIGDEAAGKARKAIEKMKELARHRPKATTEQRFR